MKQFLVFFLLPCAILLCAMDTPATYTAFHGFSPATGEGGYTTSTAQREAISLRWTPTVDVGISGWIHSLLRRNRCHSELNEYWRAYLGLDNQVPGMNPAAKTEWDDAVEHDKAAQRLRPQGRPAPLPRPAGHRRSAIASGCPEPPETLGFPTGNQALS